VYYPKVNRTNVRPAIKELPPGGQRIAHASQIQGAGEVIAATAWNDQDRRLQTYQGR
jgi:hypothetical protein